MIQDFSNDFVLDPTDDFLICNLGLLGHHSPQSNGFVSVSSVVSRLFGLLLVFVSGPAWVGWTSWSLDISSLFVCILEPGLNVEYNVFFFRWRLVEGLWSGVSSFCLCMYIRIAQARGEF